MKRQLLIIGAGGHGKVVADIAYKMNKWKNIAFLDDDESIKNCLGFHVIGNSSEVLNYIDNFEIFVAIGDNKTREKVQEKLIEEGARIAILIHPDAVIALDVEIGIGTAIMAGVIINSSTKIGEGCIINTSSSIDHDNNVGDYVHISPGAILAGTVKVGDRSWLGMGSSVINNKIIYNDCKIGANSLVINDIKKKGTYIGIPVKEERLK